MLMTKKAKIRKHLEAIGKDDWSTFEHLLSDYLDGKLSEKLQQIGIDKMEIHVDFLDDYKCIDIQGKYKRNYVDIQIEKTEFSMSACRRQALFFSLRCLLSPCPRRAAMVK